MSKQEFYKENDLLLENLLNERFFKQWKENFLFDFNIDDTSLANDSHLELFITSTCNQKCEYCYLVKHEKLYPKEINDFNKILENLKILLNWIIENSYAIKITDVFTGEIWHSRFGEQILEELLQAVKRGYKTKKIVIPSNCSFVRNSNSLQKIQYYIQEFAKYGTSLVFSISVDGKPIESYSRPLKTNEDKNDDFYEMLFSFARYNKFLFHPMVSPTNIKDWIENFCWWEEKINEFGGNIDTDIMTLEVRDGNWDDQAIQKYKEFLDFLLERRLKKLKTSENLARSLFAIETNEDFIFPEKELLTGYSPYCLPEVNTFQGCSIGTHMTVRLGDLAICPCHRTSYNKYLYGKFIVENNKITSIQAINPQMAISILLNNQKFNLSCATCVFKNYCLKGCHGAQIEACNDPFVPIPTICNFFKEKYIFLLKKYKELGVIDYLKTVSPYSPSYLRVQRFLNFYKEVNNIYGLE